MEDKVVLIVGTGGIAASCARRFATEGAHVVIAGRNLEKAAAIAEEITKERGKAYAKEVEVTELPSVSKMVRELADEHETIDVLINAFGKGIIKPMLDIRPDDARELIDVNVYGTFLVTQTVLRYMETAKQGRVVMFPGILGKRVMKGSSVYSASKFAISGFTKALIEEQKRGRIKFTLMYLGGVDTEFWDQPNMNIKVKRNKMLSPERVAAAVFNAVTQPEDTAVNEVVLQPESHQMT